MNGVAVIENNPLARLGKPDFPMIPVLLQRGLGLDIEQAHGLTFIHPLIRLRPIHLLQAQHHLVNQGIKRLVFDANNFHAAT